VEVAFLYERYDIDDELMFVQDGVYDDGHHAGEEVATENFHDDNHEATCLEDRAGESQYV